MGNINQSLRRGLEYLLSFIPLNGVLLENGGRLLRLSRNEWEYSMGDIRIRFVAEILSGEYQYIVSRSGDMWYNMNYGEIYDSSEIRDRVMRPDNRVDSIDLRQEVAESFAKYMESTGRKVIIE